MHLGFDDELVGSKGGGYFFRFFRCGGDATWTVGDTEFIEEFFGLVFVDIHLAIFEPAILNTNSPSCNHAISIMRKSFSF